MRKSGLLISALLLSSVAVSSQAAVYNLGTLSPQETETVFNLSFTSTVADEYNFTVLDTFAFTSDVLGYDVTNFVISLSKGGSYLFGQDATSASTVFPGFTTATKASIFETTLSAGNYTFSVLGNSTDGGSAYVGSFTVGRPEVAAVPEPESYAMFLAGLGLLGFVSRRRKN